MTSQTPEELQAEIEVQREQLAGTLDALTAKLDVKSQAQVKVADARSQAQAKVADVKATTQAKVAEMRERATTADGRPRPELLGLGATILVVAAVIVWWRHR